MARIQASDRDLLPHSVEAEEAVIGSLLADPDAIWRVTEVGLEPEHFYSPANAALYQSMRTMAQGGQPTSDLVLVCDTLGRRIMDGGASLLDMAGGPSELTRLIMAAVSTVNAGHYAQAVRDYALRRQVISLGGDLATLGQIDTESASELRGKVMQRVMTLVTGEEEGASHLYGGSDYLLTQQQRRERLAQDPNSLILTGIRGLDKILGDLAPGTAHVIAAKSSVGKTMYMEQIAEYNARRGHRVAFYHYELDHSYMEDRRMARYSGVTLSQLRQGYEGDEIKRAVNDIRAWQGNIVYVDAAGWTADRTAMDIARLAARGECEVAIVDYLQLLALPDTNKHGFNHAQMRGQQFLTLKVACQRAGVVPVIGSQVNRGGGMSGKERPTIDNLRDTGEIAEKANQVVILHAPTPREDRPERAVTEELEAYVAKNTGGATGVVKLVHFLGRFGIGEMSGPEQDEPEDDSEYEEIPF